MKLRTHLLQHTQEFCAGRLAPVCSFVRHPNYVLNNAAQQKGRTAQGAVHTSRCNPTASLKCAAGADKPQAQQWAAQTTQLGAQDNTAQQSNPVVQPNSVAQLYLSTAQPTIQPDRAALYYPKQSTRLVLIRLDQFSPPAKQDLTSFPKASSTRPFAFP